MSLIDTTYRIPFRRQDVRNLLQRISAGQGDNGKVLHNLTWHIIRTIPGFHPVSRKIGKGGEIDIRVRNSGHLGWPLRWIEDYFLIECKDTDAPVDEKEVGHFLTKLILNKVNQGAIISKVGLSGGREYKFASGDLKSAFTQLNIVVLDITIADLRVVESTMDFLILLQKKYERLRFR